MIEFVHYSPAPLVTASRIRPEKKLTVAFVTLRCLKNSFFVKKKKLRFTTITGKSQKYGNFLFTIQVMRAEVKVASMLAQHVNILIALADELTPLFRDVFSDSEIAKNFSSRRTKTACIINGAVAPFSVSEKTC